MYTKSSSMAYIFLLSSIIKYIPHVCHGWRFGIHLCTSFLLSTIIKYIPHVCHGWRFGIHLCTSHAPIRVNIYIELNFLKNCLFVRFTVTTRQLKERSTKTYTIAYAFSWFTKFHGFMILTGTTKIGIQQIKLSIHTSEENYENFIYCILHIFKFVNCIFYHFIIIK
jgi:hypothetical protein